jgi:hypothetical protein
MGDWLVARDAALSHPTLRPHYQHQDGDEVVLLLFEKEVNKSWLGCACCAWRQINAFFLDLPTLPSAPLLPLVIVRFTRRRISHIFPPFPFPRI